MTATRLERQLREKYLAQENLKYPEHLVEIPRDSWPSDLIPTGLSAVWRSRQFLVQVFEEKDGAVRLSICRAVMSRSGDWQDGIPWEDLQRLKAECGYGERWAVEIFPPDYDVVNVANMRHLFVLNEAPGFGWKRGETR